jgi:two-component system NtrC family sensor kinase
LRRHNIHTIIDGVVDGLLGPEMAVSNVEVIRQYGPDIPELVTDRNQLQQVLLNILNNSIDAMSGRGKITITTSLEGKKVRITLTDTGKGIKPDHLDKIFMPFFTTKEVGKGTGLGLSVSYGIIKNLGGEITVASTVGVGTTFTITLPIRPG